MLKDLEMMLLQVQSMPVNKTGEDNKISLKIKPVKQSVQQLQVVMNLGQDSSSHSICARS